MKFLGVVALIWCCLWFLLVKECPQEDRVISSKELDYINACLGSTSNQHVISESLFSRRDVSHLKNIPGLGYPVESYSHIPTRMGNRDSTLCRKLGLLYDADSITDIPER